VTRRAELAPTSQVVTVQQMKVCSHPLCARIDGMREPLFKQRDGECRVLNAVMTNAVRIAPARRPRDNNGVGRLTITANPF
jgi:hypothetical protein